jgi:uncharacterized protein HemY
MQDKRSVSIGYNNIGNIYLNQNHFKDAINYFEKSLDLKNEISDFEWTSYYVE